MCSNTPNDGRNLIKRVNQLSEIKLECLCGKVKGNTKNVNANSGTRIVCCCDDCQKFAQYLNRENDILDQYGGTDLFQMPMSHLNVIEGNELIGCIRLSDKGMHRWYAKCCNTPIGNTLGAGVPFIGVVHNFMANTHTRDMDLGESRGHIQTKFALKTVPQRKQGSSFKVNMRSLFKLIVWKINGFNKPSVFFNENGEAIAKPNILN